MPSTLAQVYDADFGQRRDDLPVWERILGGFERSHRRKIRVTEGAIGTGRIATSAAGLCVLRWSGMDADPDMIAIADMQSDFCDVSAKVGDMRNPGDWKPGDVAIIGYSSLYLLDHPGQIAAVRAALSACPFLVVECFVPRLAPGRRVVEIGPSLVMLEDGIPRRRETLYDVTPGRTYASRRYVPTDLAADEDAPVIALNETIHWRTAQGLALMLADHGTVQDITPPTCVDAVWLQVTR